MLELTGETTPVRDLVRDFWRRRDLLPMLAAKDFNGRYRSASLGLLWSILLPLVQGAVLAFVFSRIVKIPVGDDISYPVFVMSGMVTWGYVSASITAGSTAIVDQGAIAGKVYFPRLYLPVVPALANLVSLLASSVVVVGLMVAFGQDFHPTIAAYVLVGPACLVLVSLVAALGALLHVYSRDVRFIVQAGLLVAFYATPVIYPFERALDYRWALLVNPFTGLLGLTRWSVLGESAYVAQSVASTAAWCLVLAVVVLAAYRRHERIAVDRL